MYNRPSYQQDDQKEWLNRCSQQQITRVKGEKMGTQLVYVQQQQATWVPGPALHRTQMNSQNRQHHSLTMWAKHIIMHNITWTHRHTKRWSNAWIKSVMLKIMCGRCTITCHITPNICLQESILLF